MGIIPKWARWDPSNTMGSKSPINLVTGQRSLGKTYAMKKVGIKRFITKGETWSYIRYFDSMVDRITKASEDFLSDIERNEEFPGYIFRTHGRMLQLAEVQATSKATEGVFKPKWRDMGQMMALTSYDSYKGTTVANMSLMVLDEFIKEKRVPPYPPGCVDMLLNLWETIDRREDRVRIVMLANTADIVNPFFRAWNITPIERGTSRYFPVGDMSVYYENAYNADFAQFADQSNIGKLTRGSSYGDYAGRNEFKNETGLFVAQKPKSAKCYGAYVWGPTTFGIWNDINSGNVYVNQRPDKVVRPVVLTRDDMAPDYMMIEKSSPMLKFPLKAYRYGQLFFDSDVTRELFLNMLELVGLR